MGRLIGSLILYKLKNLRYFSVMKSKKVSHQHHRSHSGHYESFRLLTSAKPTRLNRSSYQVPSNNPSLAHVHSLPAPAPTALIQKFSQALPLPFHLLLSGFLTFASTIVAILSYIIDGPLKPSWNFATSICQATLKSIMANNPPQGRHSFDIVRLASSFSIPAFIFGASQEDAHIHISGTDELSDIVKDALGVNDMLLHSPSHPDDGKRMLNAEWIRHKSVNAPDSSETVILYLHGGAHIFMSPQTHRVITSKLSMSTQSHVFAVDYRLAPEAPFPSAVEDALAAYLALIGESIPNVDISLENSGVRPESIHVSGHVSPRRIFFAGDSSGCALSLQLVQCLTALNLPLPAGLIFLSPFLDHSISYPGWHTNYSYDFMSMDIAGVKWASQLYANGVPLDHPSLSPCFNKQGSYPPILIQCGDSEVVSDDSRVFAEIARKSGNHVEMQIFQDMFHVFHTFPFVPEAATAFRLAGEFVSSVLSSDLDSTLGSVSPIHEKVGASSTSSGSDSGIDGDAELEY